MMPEKKKAKYPKGDINTRKIRRPQGDYFIEHHKISGLLVVTPVGETLKNNPLQVHIKPYPPGYSVKVHKNNWGGWRENIKDAIAYAIVLLDNPELHRKVRDLEKEEIDRYMHTFPDTDFKP